MSRTLIAHPSADLYGSDLQLVETVRGLVASRWDVTVIVPGPGPLVALLRAAGAEVLELPFAVLRKAYLRPRALPGFVVGSLRTVGRARRLLRAAKPDRLLVSTMTAPAWILGARLAGVRTIVHVHEAERDLPLALRWAITAPLLGAHRVVANSASTVAVLVGTLGSLGRRIVLVHNGVAGPQVPVPELAGRHASDPAVIACIGRLSPRKGVEVALEAIALLRAQGRDVRILLAGSVFVGYEWFERRLRARAARPDLAGAVDFLGYADKWAVLGRTDIAVMPSHGESFGNAAVEALLVGRPLVASHVQGLAEIVRDRETGLLVAPGDPGALASAIGELLDDPAWARGLAEAGRDAVATRFSVEAYRAGVVAAVAS